VSAHPTVGVELERKAQELESCLVEEQVAVPLKLTGERCRTRPVLWITAVVFAPRVVQQPEREHDLRIGTGLGGKVEPRGRDREPMGLPVQR
jgi:hypothetical protein